MKLNYETLIKSYNENLEINLRGFRGGEGFLETWVYDTNHERGLAEIVRLARNANIHRLDIEIPSDIYEELDSMDFIYLDKKSQSIIYRSEHYMNVMSGILYFCAEHGLQRNIDIIDIIGRRVILSFKQDPAMPDFAHHMIKCERYLKHELNTKFELECEPLEDKNKRQLRNSL